MKVEGYTPEVADVILHSRRNSTDKQYVPHIKAWENFCFVNKFNPVYTTIQNVLMFLQTVFDRQLSYSSINTAKSALSTCVILPNNEQLG